MMSQSSDAKILYLAGKTFEEIAKSLKVKEGTVKLWAKKQGWEVIKDLKDISRTELLKDLKLNLHNINKQIKEEFDGVPNKDHVAAQKIIFEGIKTLQQEDFAYMIEVCEELLTHISLNSPNKVKGFEDLIKNYVDEKIGPQD